MLCYNEIMDNGYVYNVEKEKKPPVLIFILIIIIETIAIIVLSVILVMSKQEESIANDSSENVQLNTSGRVESIGVSCKLDDGTLYLEKSNSYFIEPDEKNTSFVSVGLGEYEESRVNKEEGSYAIDGNIIRLAPKEGEKYFATYSSHKLMIGDKTFECSNYE